LYTSLFIIFKNLRRCPSRNKEVDRGYHSAQNPHCLVGNNIYLFFGIIAGIKVCVLKEI
jgi:hypothetical protein